VPLRRSAPTSQPTPQICFSRPKETFYFCWEKFHDRGISWYESCFSPREGEEVIGEGTTLYACIETYPSVIGRVQATLGRPKIVFCVREPFSRMQSYHIELRSQGLTRKSFAEHLRENTEYIDGSMYGRTYDAYVEAFGEESVHCIVYDDFKADAGREMSRCFAFLGVDDAFVPEGVSDRIYGSDGKREDRPVVNLLRRALPGFEAMRNMAPTPLRSAAKQLLKTPIEGRPEWDPASRAWAASRVVPDVEAFLRRIDREELIDPWLADFADG
jgi:hypothetical protein